MANWDDYTHGPRPSGWALFLAAGGRVVVFGIVALVVLTVLASRDTLVQNALNTRGETVQARVVVKQKINREQEVNGGEDRHRVWLRFDLPGQGTQVQPKRVTGSLYDALEIDEVRDVRVLPDQPDVIELTPGEFQSQSKDLQSIALLIGAGVLFAIWRFGRRAVSALQARRNGFSILATVTDKGMRLHWLDQKGIKGKSLKSSPDRYQSYIIGAQVELFVGRDGRAWWIGDIGPQE